MTSTVSYNGTELNKFLASSEVTKILKRTILLQLRIKYDLKKVCSRGP